MLRLSMGLMEGEDELLHIHRLDNAASKVMEMRDEVDARMEEWHVKVRTFDSSADGVWIQTERGEGSILDVDGRLFGYESEWMDGLKLNWIVSTLHMLWCRWRRPRRR